MYINEDKYKENVFNTFTIICNYNYNLIKLKSLYC